MKRKGFTLIELLAVIVVLAIIALIAVPTILGVIESARKGAFKDSVYGVMESADIYIASNFGVPDGEFICNGKKCYSGKKELSFKGETPKSGTVKIENNKVSVAFLSNGKYCANGTREKLKISDDCISLDETEAEIKGTINYRSTTNSITIIIPGDFAIDKESGIKEYQVTLNGETKTVTYNGTDKMITFEKLESGKSYEAIVKVINNNNKEKEAKLNTETLSFNKPNIELVNNPEEAVNGYLKNQIAKVTYDSTNLENPQYFIKTTREVKVSEDSVGKVIKSCTNDSLGNPSECTGVEATTLEANVWYEVSGDVNVIYSVASSTTDTIYAMTYDGTNYSGSITGTISKIDTISPTVTLGSVTKTTNSAVISYTMEDKESGLGSPTCKYGTTNKTYDKTGTSVSTSSCTIPNMSKETTYYYQICVSDKVGNEKTCKTGSTETELITNPSITLTSTPTTAVNGYVKSQVAKVVYNSTNISNPQYFIKTTRAGTSSISVTSTCGTGANPGACTAITSTTSLAANTWYKVSGNLNVTYSAASSTTGTITALTYDGTNYSGAETGVISKIDISGPSIPTISYNSGSNTCSWKNNYNLTLSSTDDGAGFDHYEIDLDGNGTKDGNVSSNYIPENGVNSHNVKFRAVDKLGNTSEWTAAQHIHMDTQAPGTTNITYNGGSNTCSWKNNYNLTLSASDNASGVSYYEVDLDGNGTSDTTTSSNYIPENGVNSHNVKFRAVDRGGNKGAWTAAQHIHMDTAVPGTTNITYNGGSNTCSWKNNYNLTLSSSDNIGVAHYEVDSDGDGVANFITASNYIPGNGYNSCNNRFRAVDYAGNKGSWTAAQHIHMDTTYPTISFPITRANNQNTNNVYSVTYGPSGGTISCQNLTFNNASVNTFKSVNAIGTSTIRCTAVSNSGNTTVNQANITTTGLFDGSSSSLGVTNGAYRNGSLIILPADTTSGLTPPVQYGPYFYATPGCYNVWYYGANLNASVQGYKAIYGAQSLPMYGLQYVSADSHYNFLVSNNLSNLELKLINYSSSIISISKITVEPAPSSWCS